MKSPFKFLDAFELKDRQVFFGRTEETDALYNMVFKTPLLLVYGLSGTGKTSLIQCGLAGRFTGPNWFPSFIRRGDDLNASIRKALAAVAPEDTPLPASLKDAVSLLFRYYLRPVYLIFDQFEELFILGDRAEQLAFARSIRELVETELPCKIIFVMREEFIGQLYHLEKEIPSIYDFRLRVEPMGFKKVQEVIAGSFEAFNVTVESPGRNIEHIYNNISAGKSGVQLPYLQVYLDMLWREDFAHRYTPAQQADWGARMEADQGIYPPLTLTTRELEAFGAIEDVLARFLREQEIGLLKALQEHYPAVPANAVRQILDAFVTEEGTKRPVHFVRTGDTYALEARVAELLPALPPGALDFALARLAATRLLRERDDALELAHDALAALIDQERSDEERRLNEVHNRLRNAWQEHRLSGGQEYPSKKLLLDLEDIFDKLPLAPELLDFYRKSVEVVEQKEVAEQKRRQEELEKEKNLRSLAERHARRARQRTRFAAVVALLAMALASLILWQNRALQAAKIDLAEQQQQAEQERDKAQEALQRFWQEEADNVMQEVNDLLLRARELRARYPQDALEIQKSAQRILDKYPENPVLQERREQLLFNR